MSAQVDEMPKPTIYQTAVFRLPLWLYSRSIGKALGKRTDENMTVVEGKEQDRTEDSLIRNATAPNRNAEMRKRRANDRIRPQGDVEI